MGCILSEEGFGNDLPPGVDLSRIKRQGMLKIVLEFLISPLLCHPSQFCF